MRLPYEQLEQKIEQLERTIRELLELVHQLKTDNLRLKQENLRLKAEITELRIRLNKNSSNSSKPPSSDQKANTPKCENSEKGVARHPGVSRRLLPPSMVTSRESRRLDVCPRCRSCMELTGKITKWQQIDLPPIIPLVHEIELCECKCPKCSMVSTPELHDEEKYLMGPRLEGFVSLLMAQFRHSHLAVRSFVQLLIPELELSQGLISKAKRRAAQAFGQAASQLHQAILSSSGPKFVDATGWRHEGRNYNALIVRSPQMIRYFLMEKQNGDVLSEILPAGPHFLVSDRGLATQKVNVRHLQHCLAHFLRNIKGLAEDPRITLEETQTLGEIHETLQELFHDHHRYKRAEIGRETWRQYSYRKWACLRERLEELKDCGSSKTLKRFCGKALSGWKHFMVYLAQDGPMTNNLAEEGLRNLVIARKLCFGSRSPYGLKWREAVHSCVETLRRQKRSLLDFFAETILAARVQTSAPRIT